MTPAGGVDGSPSAVSESNFLRACRRIPATATPIWLMRQAGRHMAAYQRLREQHSFIHLLATPELACEITLQPVDRYGLDAGIIFADILTPLQDMGLPLEYIDKKGPVLARPIESRGDIDNLHVPEPDSITPYSLDAIRLASRELHNRNLPLIGFAGGPFTLASYAVEGGSSRDQLKVKRLMMSEPDIWHGLMTVLSELVGNSLLAQAAAGADALQLFDSWAGILSPADYAELVLPHTKRALKIASAAGLPLIQFGTDTAGILDLMSTAGVDVVGVDWRIDLLRAWKLVGPEYAVQGNLDPAALLAPTDQMLARAKSLLDNVAGRPGHIFNLGHGVPPNATEDSVARLVDFVHEHSAVPVPND